MHGVNRTTRYFNHNLQDSERDAPTDKIDLGITLRLRTI